jgi:hypothetical protein
MLRAWGRLWFESTLLNVRVSDNLAVSSGDGVVRQRRHDLVFNSYSEHEEFGVTIDEPRGNFASFELPGSGSAVGFSPPLVARSLRFNPESLRSPASTFGHQLSGYLSAWTSGTRSMTYGLSPSYDASPYDHIVFRAGRPQCGQEQCFPFDPTNADLSFGVTVSSPGASATVLTSALPGRRVPPPYVYQGRTAAEFRRSVMRSVRVPMRCFPGVDRTQVSSIVIAPQGAPQQMMFSELRYEATP